MRIGIVTDHGGFGLKEEIVKRLTTVSHEVIDLGAYKFKQEDDYPDFVIPLAKAGAEGMVDRGVAICGSGVGASVCANKIAGVRAGLIHDHFSARQGVEDDDMNILCMGGRTLGRKWHGNLLLRSWRQSSVMPNAMCVVCTKWHFSKKDWKINRDKKQ